MHSVGKSMELETERENKMLLKNLRKNRLWHDGFPENCLCFYPSGKEMSATRALLPWEMSPMSHIPLPWNQHPRDDSHCAALWHFFSFNFLSFEISKKKKKIPKHVFLPRVSSKLIPTTTHTLQCNFSP